MYKVEKFQTDSNKTLKYVNKYVIEL